MSKHPDFSSQKDKPSDSESTTHSRYVKKLTEGNFYPELNSESFGKRGETAQKLASINNSSLMLFSVCPGKKAEGEGEMEKDLGYERMSRPRLNMGRLVNFGQNFGSGFGAIC
jgi:hypothetical protein